MKPDFLSNKQSFLLRWAAATSLGLAIWFAIYFRFDQQTDYPSPWIRLLVFSLAVFLLSFLQSIVLGNPSGISAPWVASGIASILIGVAAYAVIEALERLEFFELKGRGIPLAAGFIPAGIILVLLQWYFIRRRYGNAQKWLIGNAIALILAYPVFCWIFRAFLSILFGCVFSCDTTRITIIGFLTGLVYGFQLGLVTGNILWTISSSSGGTHTYETVHQPNSKSLL